MQRIITYIILGIICSVFLFGCYFGAVYADDDSWSDLSSSQTEDIFEVTVITESGNSLAYQGEVLLISVNSEKNTEPISIGLTDGSETTTLIDDFSGQYPYSWLIPENFPPGECYRILINAQDYIKDSIPNGYSDEFAILDSIVSGLSDITVSTPGIEITLTDNGSVIDGDTVSIYLNSTVLAENHVLNEYPGTIMNIDLLPGSNTLSITAVNEGSVSPNTAEIMFTDVITGESTQQWRLNAGETGTLFISAP
ncbi:MAG TPA: hypothetical protein DCO79_02190 [Spirochaeta sp.]|nr:hypothetical protein [Spirochaeta sp.]